MTNLSCMEVDIIKQINVFIDKEVGLDIIKKCGKNCFSTYWAIRSHKNKAYDSCYPSLKVLSEECACSTRTVQRDIAILIENGFLFTTIGHTGKNSSYFFIREPGIYSKEELDKINKLIKTKLIIKEVRQA